MTTETLEQAVAVVMPASREEADLSRTVEDMLATLDSIGEQQVVVGARVLQRPVQHYPRMHGKQNRRPTQLSETTAALRQRSHRSSPLVITGCHMAMLKPNSADNYTTNLSATSGLYYPYSSEAGYSEFGFALRPGLAVRRRSSMGRFVACALGGGAHGS
jgi:hypothetical protein